MLDIEKIKPYIGLYDTKPCYKNGEKHEFGNRIELTIQMTNRCNAKCSFCSNSKYSDYIFDFKKFKEVFFTLKDNYEIVKVAFTGGEPTLHKDFLYTLMFIRSQLSNTEIVINTNASHLDILAETYGMRLEYGISRHHYNDEKNWEIFKSHAPATAEVLDNFKEKNNCLIHCNLIKNYIDSTDECIKYINWLDLLGFTRLGFVELMPYTQDAIKDKVEIDLTEIPDSYISRFAERPDICRCMNIMYKNKINIYTRDIYANDCNDLPNAPFVYNMNMLRHSFNGPIIWDMN